MKTKDTIYKTLIEYADKVKDCDRLYLVDVMEELLMQINERTNSNLINGKRILIDNIMNEIIREKIEYRKYPFDKNKEWIFKEFHDNYFDYDGIKRDIMKCMDSFIKDYENK